ncbi:MAG: hypothetical protein JW952_03965 [Candidatus Eisenbacteria bacterium]|nr:hypothetical protein [Candidatus Eisenbacteria bacterium]
MSTLESRDAGPAIRGKAGVSAICVRPIGTDLVAATAFDTLSRKMGFGNVLESLRRETLWLLSFDCEESRAAELTAALAENTGIFVNPNTHRHVLVPPGRPIPAGRADCLETVAAALWSYDDPQSGPVEAAVRERMKMTELLGLRRMTVWWPGVRGAAERGRRPAEVVLSLVATRSRLEGLLANPHSEGWYLVESPHTPAMMLAAVEEIEGRQDGLPDE